MALLLEMVANLQFGTSAAVSQEATSGLDLSHRLTDCLCRVRSYVYWTSWHCR